jgi:DNA polymerase V
LFLLPPALQTSHGKCVPQVVDARPWVIATLMLTSAAIQGLKAIFRKGFKYKKAEVLLTMISDKSHQQASLFEDTDDEEKATRLMQTLEAINRRYGRDTLHTGLVGNRSAWAMKSENHSPNYTTRWDELPVAS